MKVPYPKVPGEILIHIMREDSKPGFLKSFLGSTKEPTALYLSSLLSDYIVQLSHSSHTHTVYNIIVHLMTDKKVKVVYTDGNIERLELVDASDTLSSAQAVSMLEDFATRIGSSEIFRHSKLTHKITLKVRPKHKKN